MNVSAKFWDRLANNFDNIEGQYHQLYIKIVENAKKYLSASDLALDYGCAIGTPVGVGYLIRLGFPLKQPTDSHGVDD